MTDPKRPAESFARLYDDILDNPKVVLISPSEFGLHCALMVYSHKEDTDGRVPLARARGLLAFSDSGFKAALNSLLRVGLVEADDAGFLFVHDYLQHNNSHAERIAKREAARKAARIKWSNASGNAEPHANGLPRIKGEGLRENLNASSVGSLAPSEPALELAVAIAEVLNVPVLAPLEIQACEQALVEFPYLIPAELVDRAKAHQEACRQKNFPLARTVQGLWEAWRSQNDYNADHGRVKPRGQAVGAMTRAFGS